MYRFSSMEYRASAKFRATRAFAHSLIFRRSSAITRAQNLLQIWLTDMWAK